MKKADKSKENEEKRDRDRERSNNHQENAKTNKLYIKLLTYML